MRVKKHIARTLKHTADRTEDELGRRSNVNGIAYINGDYTMCGVINRANVYIVYILVHFARSQFAGLHTVVYSVVDMDLIHVQVLYLFIFACCFFCVRGNIVGFSTSVRSAHEASARRLRVYTIYMYMYSIIYVHAQEI